MLKSIAIYPPLAFARLGASATCCAAFSWARTTLSPDQPPTTTLKPEETLTLDAAGVVTAAVPNEIVLKDDSGYRPVCPFFELWGRWEEEGVETEGPLTEATLGRFGLALGDLVWTVELANLKPYHVTMRDSDRIAARLELQGDQTAKAPLFGRSPEGPAALVSHAEGIPLGAAQLARPSDDFPELRLRFYAPAGLVYGPPNVAERIAAILEANDDPDLVDSAKTWQDLDLPPERRRVNPASGWATHDFATTPVPPIGPGDPRLNPGGLVASIGSVSIGLVDDVSDGVISCAVGGLRAQARIAVGPPDFAPMNRPIVSLQDGLADRELRAEARDGSLSDAELEAIVADIFERALETSDLMNKDAQNDRAWGENRGFDDGSGNPLVLPNPGPGFEEVPRRTLWPTLAVGQAGPIGPRTVDAMPVTFLGQRKHRRYNAIEYLRDRLKEEPELIERWLRPPRGSDAYFDRRMPALMRGSDRNAMHLTRRQYELIQLWAKRQRDAP